MVLLVVAVILQFDGTGALTVLPLLPLLTLYAAIFGIVFLIAGWIVEGFAIPPAVEPQPHIDVD